MIKMYYENMKIHRFIGVFDLSKKEIEIVNPENIKQIRDVLRLKIGEKIIISDGKGKEAETAINEVSKDKILVSVLELTNKKEQERKISLYLAILKKENFELAVQKAVEVGVSNIVPIVTERTIKTGLNIDRLEKIILEASEQSGRSTVPTISSIFNFKDALEIGKSSEEKFIFHTKEENSVYTPNKTAKNVSIFIGPEGGFTEKEIGLAKDSGYFVASLGTLTLRGETAAIVATYRAVNAI
ncbi:16S rRNA (uracil(1498)-N(3))-methyltransferase [Candidatus Nomurabacteria bacterium]|nr:16S rRNA (uracil(1498)-N(3))-methyltransferase [Candidatus Nomurabacteria bacterium]